KNMKFTIVQLIIVVYHFIFTAVLENKVIFLSKNFISSNPTTRFLLKNSSTERELYLKPLCDPIEFRNSDADGVLISPVFNEVSEETLEQIKEFSDFTLLDPQGYLRRINSDKKVYLEKTTLELPKISDIKTNPNED